MEIVTGTFLSLWLLLPAATRGNAIQAGMVHLEEVITGVELHQGPQETEILLWQNNTEIIRGMGLRGKGSLHPLYSIIGTCNLIFCPLQDNLYMGSHHNPIHI